MPTFSQIQSVENGYINLSTGDLHIEIPLGAYLQRGGKHYKVALMYDSNIWARLVGAGSQQTSLDRIASPLRSEGGVWLLRETMSRYVHQLC